MKLTPIIIKSILAIVLIAPSIYAPTWPAAIRSVLLICGLVFIFFAGVEFINWTMQVYIARQRDLKKNDGINAETVALEKRIELARAMRQLPPEAWNAIQNYGPLVSALAGSAGPIASLKTGEVDIPYTFIDVFFAKSTELELCPNSTWSDGSRDRQYAEALVAWLSLRGYVVYLGRHGGPRPTRWAYRGARTDALNDIYGSRIASA